MKSTPAMVNWISRAPCNSAASPDRRSLAVLFVKRAPALRSASARAAPSSSARYMIAVAPASPSATIDLRLSLSSKATTSGGGLNSMRPQITPARLAKLRLRHLMQLMKVPPPIKQWRFDRDVERAHRCTSYDVTPQASSSSAYREEGILCVVALETTKFLSKPSPATDFSIVLPCLAGVLLLLVR